MLERAVMAVWVIAAATEEDVRGPAAAALAFVGVVAARAEAPEIGGRLRGVATKRELLGALPDLAEAPLADVAAGIRCARQGRAALDASIRFDAEGEDACRAAGVVAVAVDGSAEHAL